MAEASESRANDTLKSARARSVETCDTTYFAEEAPRRTQSCFTRLPDGHYVEPFHPNLVDYNVRSGSLIYSKTKARDTRLARSRAREAELSATVVCVRRTPQNVLVRFMPREEWVHIKEREEVLSVKDGRLGETTEHVVASPLLRTVPGGAQLSRSAASRPTSLTPLPLLSLEPADDGDDEQAGGLRENTEDADPSIRTMPNLTHDNSESDAQGAGGTPPLSRSTRYVPWSCYANESSRVAEASASEPLVYDYFVAPENVAAKARHAKKSSLSGYLKYKMSYSPQKVEALEREYRRSFLALERRSIFLSQLQRDLQARLRRDPTYVVGRVVPDEFIQTFFLLREEQSARMRYEARRAARSAEEATRLARQVPQQLFTLDHTFSQLPFAGQAASDGLVVVSVGDPSTANKASLFDASDDDDDDAPFVPHTYGSTKYIRRRDSNNSEVSSPSSPSSPLASRTTSLARADSATPSVRVLPLQPTEATPPRHPARTSVPASPYVVTCGDVERSDASLWALQDDSRLAHRQGAKAAPKMRATTAPTTASASSASPKLTVPRAVSRHASTRELDCSLTSAKPALSNKAPKCT